MKLISVFIALTLPALSLAQVPSIRDEQELIVAAQKLKKETYYRKVLPALAQLLQRAEGVEVSWDGFLQLHRVLTYDTKPRQQQRTYQAPIGQVTEFSFVFTHVWVELNQVIGWQLAAFALRSHQAKMAAQQFQEEEYYNGLRNFYFFYRSPPSGLWVQDLLPDMVKLKDGSRIIRLSELYENYLKALYPKLQGRQRVERFRRMMMVQVDRGQISPQAAQIVAVLTGDDSEVVYSNEVKIATTQNLTANPHRPWRTIAEMTLKQLGPSSIALTAETQRAAAQVLLGEMEALTVITNLRDDFLLRHIRNVEDLAQKFDILKAAETASWRDEFKDLWTDLRERKVEIQARLAGTGRLKGVNRLFAESDFSNFMRAATVRTLQQARGQKNWDLAPTLLTELSRRKIDEVKTERYEYLVGDRFLLKLTPVVSDALTAQLIQRELVHWGKRGLTVEFETRARVRLIKDPSSKLLEGSKAGPYRIWKNGSKRVIMMHFSPPAIPAKWKILFSIEKHPTQGVIFQDDLFLGLLDVKAVR